MAKAYNRFLSAILLVSSVFLLFSCGGRENLQDGIEISDEKPNFSAETEMKSKEVFYSILEGVYIESGVLSVPPKKVEELRALSEDIWNITAGYPVSEARYNKIIADVEKNRDSFILLFSKKSLGVDVFRTVYHSLTAGGPDYTGYAFYNLLLFSMDYKYEKQMERYEKYGYLYLLEEAEEFNGQRSLLKSEIGLDNFSLAARIFIMGAELFFGGAFDGGAAEGFSSREVLTIIKRIDVDALDVSAEGYKFLLSLFVGDEPDADSGVADRILYSAEENGDLDKLSSVCGDFVKLLSLVQGKLTDADAEYLKNSRSVELIRSALSKFGDEEWAIFDRIFTIELNYSHYESIFLDIYGEDFEAYRNGVDRSVSLSELKASVGEGDFLNKMEGYFAGISPVLTYRIFK